MALEMNNLGLHIHQQSWGTTTQPRNKNETTPMHVGNNNKNLNHAYRHQHANSVPNNYYQQHQTQNVQATYNNHFINQHSPNKQFMSSQNHKNQFPAPQQTNNTHLASGGQYRYRNAQPPPVTCYCGNKMTNTKKFQISDDNILCHGCEFKLPKQSDVFCCTSCSTQGDEYKKDAFYFCDSCIKHIPKCNTNPIDPRHNSEKLYFLYNKNKISGPHLTHEIITLFVTKKLKEDKLYIMAANGGSWCKLVFPQEILKEKDYDDKKRKEFTKECEKENAEFKRQYPQLYANLIENPFTGRIKQIEEPDDIPKEEQTTSITNRIVRRILGQIVALALTVNILLHCIPTMILSSIICFIYCCIHRCCCGEINKALWISFIFFLYSGMAVTPVINVFFVLTEMNHWNEIQSWMISYVIWGIMCLMTSISHFVLIYFHKDIRILDNAILLIMGVDFGDFDVVRELKGNNPFEMFGIIFIFPSLASLLPAAAFGFIANFYLEEKFDLKCSADISISSEHLCFEEQYGCCEIISSHDIQNTYAFVGGLASNILFSWAVIRIAGYLLVQGFPKLALFARKKN